MPEEPIEPTEQADTEPASADEAPAPIERDTGRRLTILAAGCVLALLLVVIITNLGSPHVGNPVAARSEREPIELIAPEALSDEQLAGTSDMTDLGVADLAVQGGWIQVTDDAGQLAQQYRFERLDPNPSKGPGWAEMTTPEAELYLSDNRVVVLSGDRALAYTPSRALESGSLFGNVTIHVYETDGRQSIDPNNDAPALTIRTDEAQFDGMLGEVYCPGEVLISSTHAELPGSELRVLLNDQQEQIALRMSRVDHIILRGGANLTDGHRSQGDPGPASASDDSPTAIDITRIYRLVMPENVRITQRSDRGMRTVSGDSLTAVFSADSAAFGDALAAAVTPNHLPQERTGPTASPWPGNPQWLFAFAAIGSSTQGAYDDLAVGDTLITFDGPLLIEPWRTDQHGLEHGLASADDALVTISGEPVLIVDDAQSLEAQAALLTYRRETESVELLADAPTSLLVASPDLTATGERFLYTRSDGRAQFIGSGWLAPERLDLDRATSQDAAAAGEIIAQLQITWKKGVDLQFDPDAADTDAIGNLRSVRFTGDVQVQSEDGNIYTDDLQLTLGVDKAGKPVPEQMIALGGVKTTDAMRTMWADQLTVDFEEIAGDAAAPRVNQPGSISARVSDDTMIRNLHAQGDVQVMLADGSRAFADELIGDGIAETLELRGEQIVIAAGRMLIDRGKTIIFDGKEQTGHWQGPGQLFIYDRIIDTSADERIIRPVINHDKTPPNVKARWNESMQLDGAANDGAGEVTLDGDVFAESRPSPVEYNRLEGQQVTLAFRPDDADPARAQMATDDPLDRVKNRKLERFIARGAAKLENRLWRNEDRSDKPRVFYIGGPLLEYNDRTFEARVLGSGELLFQDTFIDPNDVDTPREPTSTDIGLTGAFRGKGTSLFRWRDELTMQAAPGGEEGEHIISLRGEVTAIHRDLANETATLTGDAVDAHVMRLAPDEEGEDDGDAALDNPARAAQLDLGGSFDLRRITGEGAMVIQARRHTVTCDAFDYDLESGIAEARATEGRTVAVLTADATQPLRVGSVLWDLARDVITVRRGSGGG